MATQRDLSKIVGLSQATVSLALKGHPRISEKTRKRVLEAAEEIGYRPNPYIQALMSSRRPGRKDAPVYPVLLYISNYPVEEQGTIAQVRAAAITTAEELGFVIEQAPLPQTPELTLQRMVRAKNIRGIILGPTTLPAPLPELSWENLAVVAISEFFESDQIDRISCDHFFNVRLALEELVAQGSKRPGIIYPQRNNQIVNRAWSAGYLDFAHEHSQKLKLPTPLELDTIDPQTIYDWSASERPDAILFFPNTLLETLSTLPSPSPRLAMIQWQDFKKNSICGIDVKAETIGTLAVREVTSRILRSQFGLNPNPQITLIRGSWRQASG